MIDLTDDQLQYIIQNILNKEEGLNELLEHILNALMKIERSHWMTSQVTPDNKARHCPKKSVVCTRFRLFEEMYVYDILENLRSLKAVLSFA